VVVEVETVPHLVVVEVETVPHLVVVEVETVPHLVVKVDALIQEVVDLVVGPNVDKMNHKVVGRCCRT
jgi:hypothetical protein